MILSIMKSTFSPDNNTYDVNLIKQVLEKFEQVTQLDSSYSFRRNAELCLLAIKERNKL